MELSHIHAVIVELALAASKQAMDFFHSRNFSIKSKEDGSPVTTADLVADEIICTGLKKAYPEIEIISEESYTGEAPRSDEFFLIDPIDGTRGFVRGNNEFTINIAYLSKYVPRLGVVCAPALDEIYYNTPCGKVIQISNLFTTSSNTQEIIFEPADNLRLRAVVSRSHSRREKELRMIQEYRISNVTHVSSSLKFCMIASREADIYPRFGPTMEWDTAAGQALLISSGGQTYVAEDRTVLKYGKETLENPSFIAMGCGVEMI